MENDAGLAGLRVLVVEDEALIGLLLEDMLDELGAAAVGPFATLAAALDAAGQDDFDVALIDMNLDGEQADPVARRLCGRGIPFALVSGDTRLESALGQTAVLHKPFGFDDIEAVLRRLARARGGA